MIEDCIEWVGIGRGCNIPEVEDETRACMFLLAGWKARWMLYENLSTVVYGKPRAR